MNLETLFDVIDTLTPDKNGCLFLPRARTKQAPMVKTSYKLIHGRRVFCGTGNRRISRLLMERATNRELDSFARVVHTCGDHNCVNVQHLKTVDLKDLFTNKKK